MNIGAIDTLEVVKELKAGGFTDGQAEALTRVVRRAQEIDLSSFPTKEDVQEIKVEIIQMKAALRESEQRTTTQLRESEQRTTTQLRESEQRTTTQLRESEQKMTTQLREGEQSSRGALRESELRMDAKIESVKSELIRWVFGAIGFQTLIIVGATLAMVKALGH